MLNVWWIEDNIMASHIELVNIDEESFLSSLASTHLINPVNEIKAFAIFKSWLVFSFVYNISADLFIFIHYAEETLCEIEEHHWYLFHSGDIVIILALGLLINVMCGGRSLLWGIRTHPFEIPIEYIWSYFVNCIIFILAVFTLLSIWTSCVNSNPHILWPLLAYFILETIIFILVLIKFPWIKKRIVFYQTDL